MNVRLAAVTFGVAAAASATAVIVPQLADASSHATASKAHTMRFVDKLAGKAIDKGPLLIQADDDYHGKKLIGTDEINCNFGRSAASCLVTLSIKGGFLYGKFSETPDGAIDGTITGGAGRYTGASGTISGPPKKPIVVTYKS